MIATICLYPHYEASESFACSPRHRDPSSKFMFAGLDNLYAQTCVFVCKTFITRPPPPPPPPLPPCSQLQPNTFQPETAKKQTQTKNHVFTSLFSTGPFSIPLAARRPSPEPQGAAPRRRRGRAAHVAQRGRAAAALRACGRGTMIETRKPTDPFKGQPEGGCSSKMH